MVDRSQMSDRCGPCRRRAAGLTLVELLVVVALIGLILTVGLPNLRRAAVRAELLQGVKLVRQALMVGRVQAIKSGRRVVVALAPDSVPQPAQTVLAWVDDSGDDVFGAGDIEVGRWPLGLRTLVGRDDTTPEWSLRALPGSRRGVVFLPAGTAIAHGDDVGIGFGTVVVTDLKDNRIRLVITAGAGTVREEMWDPDAGAWSGTLRHWRY